MVWSKTKRALSSFLVSFIVTLWSLYCLGVEAFTTTRRFTGFYVGFIHRVSFIHSFCWFGTDQVLFLDREIRSSRNPEVGVCKRLAALHSSFRHSETLVEPLKGLRAVSYPSGWTGSCTCSEFPAPPLVYACSAALTARCPRCPRCSRC